MDYERTCHECMRQKAYEEGILVGAKITHVSIAGYGFTLCNFHRKELGLRLLINELSEFGERINQEKIGIADLKFGNELIVFIGGKLFLSFKEEK